MTTFRVWAPNAQSVDALVDGQRIRMDGDGSGWYMVDAPMAGAGSDYAFALDGGEPLPDPRSLWQPQGVFGPSRVVDHSAFAWSDGLWQAPPLSAAVIYELHVGTFTPDGTFEAIIPHLDHLRELGVTHVELMPVNEFSGTHGWGYDGVDLYAPHSAYGGPDGLKRLVDACHAKGLAVLLDVVYNHLGPSGNFLGQFGPYFTERYKTPWGLALNLDGPNSDEVRRFLCDNALMWLRDYHCDGLRLDAVHMLIDSSAIHFLEQLGREVEALETEIGRHLALIAESDLNDPRIVHSREVGGYGMDAQWSDDFHHALHALLTGERAGYYADFGGIADVAYALKHVFVYDGRYSTHRQRQHGRPVTGIPGYRFLGYLQTHDQIGNRAKGERSSALLSVEQLKVAAALVCTGPFVPMFFQGEEWGASTPFQYFTDHQDVALGRAVSEGRRNEFSAFGWRLEEVPDPQHIETFQRSKLDWTELERQPHAAIYEWYRRLLRLRRSEPSLMDGRLDEVETRFDEEAQWLVMERGSICVVCNLLGETQYVPLSRSAHWETLLTSQSETQVTAEGVVAPPTSVVIVVAR